MEPLNEALNSVLYFSLNPFAWVMAIKFSMQSRKLRRPFIAAIIAQTGISCILIALIAWSDSAFPFKDIFTVVLIPGVLSGILIGAVVILFTKPRRLLQRFSSQRAGKLAYK